MLVVDKRIDKERLFLKTWLAAETPSLSQVVYSWRLTATLKTSRTATLR